ncbi:MAG: hypothetical protein MUC42_02305 [Bryobacter sp.]|nr:hypothetical protein [Bryobacter sp.]
MKFLLALALVAAPLGAATSTAWEMNNWQDFIKGKFRGLVLTRDGALRLGPKRTEILNTEQAAVWSVARAADGTLYLGTGHRGRIYKVDPAGKATVYWTAPEPEVFALALDARGVLFAGTSPDGKIYRIENGAAKEYFAPKSRYIWALAFDTKGVLYAATGDQGKIFAIPSEGQGQVHYDTQQSHALNLAFDAAGRLLVGTEPNGILYRISARDQGFVLYDANLPEIRALLPQPDGSVYVAALGGSLAKRTTGTATGGAGAAGGAPVTAPSISITVTDEAQGGLNVKPAEQPKTQPAPAASALSPVIEMAGVEKSAIYRIRPDNTVETLWSSKEENVYDIAESSGQILFGTDNQGRIYQLGADRKAALVEQSGEGEIVRLIPGPALLAATANLGKLLRLEAAPGAAGEYESPVHDAGNVARWGRVSWIAQTPAATQVTFRTRSGNSARPDRTWSEWSAPLAAPGAITSPNARFIQWKADFSGNGGTAELDAVTVAYLPQNSPPVLKTITATLTFAAITTTAKTNPSPAGTYSITVTDTGDAGASTLSGTPTQTVPRPGVRQLTLVWTAEDPDSDPLLYTVSYRAEDERTWKTLKNSIPESSLTIDGDALADGRYYFRVQATDRAGNPVEQAQETELISAPTLIDQTPPSVRLVSARREGAQATVRVAATDSVSAVRRCEASVNAGIWAPIAAVDGVADSLGEEFEFRTTTLRPGEQVIVFRAFDAAGNAGLFRLVLPEATGR